MGVTLITLTGGEPFFREQDDRLITRAAADFPDNGFLVYTNASLIDEAAAERLGEAGNVFPAISVEGYERETDGAARKRLHDARLPRPQHAGREQGDVRFLGDGHSQERRPAEFRRIH